MLSNQHQGNIQPGLDLEEHEGGINAKRVAISFGTNALASLVSIGTTTTQIVPANTDRLSLILRNISNTTIFISFVSPATTSSMYLKQDDALTLDRSKTSVFGIVASGGGEIRYL